jgi:hypothetical protein
MGYLFNFTRRGGWSANGRCASCASPSGERSVGLIGIKR